ncbi:MAG: hypothetical protein MOGMAGMI_01548 [Candidatus Omnitrophica bacterium]|nr:hypothetical protein [Candidatus Omnitrophota bacterium]
MAAQQPLTASLLRPGPLWAVLVAAVLTAQTFWLQHGKGDELFYVATAMKLEASGWSGYSLRGVDDRRVQGIYREFTPAASGAEGTLLSALKKSGAVYYDAPLLTQPPLLSLLIQGSHRLLDGRSAYRILPFPLPFPRDLRPSEANTVRWRVVRTQLYAALWPFLFGLLSVGAVYALTLELSDDRRAATWASLLMAAAPEHLLASSKIWADTAVTVLVTLSVWAWIRARRSDSSPMALAAGALCGLAALAKTTGYLPLLVVAAMYLRGLVLRQRERSLVPFAVGTAVLSAPWYLYVAAVYGDPLYVNILSQPVPAGEWFGELASRPLGYYLVNLPYQTPLILAAAAAPVALWTARTPGARSLLAAWVLLPLTVLYATKEMRYLLPLYPPLLALAGAGLERARRYLDGIRPPTGSLVTAAALAASLLWSASIGLSHAAAGSGLIKAPF